LLDDPVGVLEGNGKQVRQISLKRPDEIKTHILKPLIIKATQIALLTREEKAAQMLEREALLEAKISSQ
jgi:hypothetical protein